MVGSPLKYSDHFLKKGVDRKGYSMMVARLSIVFKIHSLSLECSVLQKNRRSCVTKSCDKDDVIQHSLFSKFVTK